SKKTGMTRQDVLNYVKVLIITHGKAGAVIFADGQQFDIPVFPLADGAIVDPTGAGDGFRAGILRGMTLGWPWDVAGRSAALCAAYVLENVGPQGHHYSTADFVARYRSVFDDRGVLDSLVTSAQKVKS